MKPKDTLSALEERRKRNIDNHECNRIVSGILAAALEAGVVEPEENLGPISTTGKPGVKLAWLRDDVTIEILAYKKVY